MTVSHPKLSETTLIRDALPTLQASTVAIKSNIDTFRAGTQAIKDDFCIYSRCPSTSIFHMYKRAPLLSEIAQKSAAAPHYMMGQVDPFWTNTILSATRDIDPTRSGYDD
jgi:hypothetical protein